MPIGFTLEMPVHPSALGPEVIELARAAEAARFTALAYTDHPAPPATWLGDGGHPTFEPFAALAFCAAATRRIGVMTHLAVAPYRNPMLLAKAVATVDRLSSGRLTLAVGAGYLRSEFMALGRSFDDRAALVEEALDVLDGVFAPEPFTYEGRGWRSLGQVSSPAPVQGPRPPVWIGGSSRRSIELAARRADGWTPLITDRSRADTIRTGVLGLDDLPGAVDHLHELAAANGRDPAQLAVQVDSSQTIDDALARPDEHHALLDRLTGGGVTSIVTRPRRGPGPSELVDLVGRYGACFVGPRAPADTPTHPSNGGTP